MPRIDVSKPPEIPDYAEQLLKGMKIDLLTMMRTNMRSGLAAIDAELKRRAHLADRRAIKRATKLRNGR